MLQALRGETTRAHVELRLPRKKGERQGLRWKESRIELNGVDGQQLNRLGNLFRTLVLRISQIVY